MKKIVVIGGGFAGTTVVRRLEMDFDVTFIDSKDYFEFTPGILRTIVEPEHMRKIQILHNHYLHRAKFIMGHVSEIGKDFVLIKRKKISFDYLIICSGSKYLNPIKRPDFVVVTRAKELREYNHKLSIAKDVLIIGGGLVGVELAGEICTFYPDKKLTIVHAREKIMERNHQKAIDYAEKFLRKKNINIIYSERVISSKNKVYLTDNGTSIKTDLVFLCTGIEPNFELLEKNFSNLLNERHQVKVNNFIQILGCENVFAPGDLNDLPVEKTAQNAEIQANIVVDNIYAMENNKPLKEYTSKKTPLVISLGKWKGIFASDKLIMTGIVPGIIKRFIEWKEMRKFRKIL